ncbi:cysteine desulfurase family protein [Nocardia wallacei]|uniref:Cysteine desulfurase n=1 Tax=Nocardia wallacei TaxID=480035 RepID=A0A7G1KQX2_9NOCA|nr:cysteine desulfurase family protein [Nocardia wallacei]BCK56289.1 cysteine desulfurase [Nocardia wallacei]
MTRQAPIPAALADGPVYLEYNATTPVDRRVVDALLPYLHHDFGNPSSSHRYADTPRTALARSRAQVAALIGATAEEVVSTASGSEANLLALRGAALASRSARPHIVTQVSEQPAVLHTCRALERPHGARVTLLPVDSDGLVDPATLAAVVDDETVLVSVMAANNETGALQPISELAAIAHRHDAVFHCDAAQAAGKMPLDVQALGVDLLTVVGHKMYAPKGIGALYVRGGVVLEPVVYGGGQEHGLRAGTENVALAVALGAAADLASGSADRSRRLRDDLHRWLAEALPGRVHLNGPAAARLPNTLNISIDDTLGHESLTAAPQLAASTGSACRSGTHTPSPVLTAMGFTDQRALAALRLSLAAGAHPTTSPRPSRRSPTLQRRTTAEPAAHRRRPWRSRAMPRSSLGAAVASTSDVSGIATSRHGSRIGRYRTVPERISR